MKVFNQFKGATKKMVALFKDGTPFEVITTALNLSAIGAAIGSTIILSTIIYNNVLELWPWPPLAFAITIAMEMVVLFMIDFSLRRTLGFTIRLIFSGQMLANRFAFALGAILLLWNAGQLFVTAKLGWDGRKDAIEWVVKPPKEMDPVAERLKVGNQQAKTYEIINGQIADLKTRIEANKKRIRQDHPTFVEKIESGQDKWGWYSSELNKKINAINAPLLHQLSRLNESLANAIDSDVAANPEIVAMVNTANQQRFKTYVDKKTRNEKYIGWFSIIAAGFVLMLSIIRELMRGLATDWEFDVSVEVGKIQHTATQIRNATQAATQKPIPSTQFAGGGSTQPHKVANMGNTHKTPSLTTPFEPQHTQAIRKKPNTGSNTVKFVDLATIDKNLRQWWKRSHTASKEATRKRNAEKFKRAVEVLKPLGVLYTPVPGDELRLDRTIQDGANGDKINKALETFKV